MILVSVIIPTINRSCLLKGVLRSLVNQTFPKENFEVIVNDNGSTDDTQDVIESFRSQLPNLVNLYDATPGLHVGRHNGYKLAKGDILVYADDDIEAFPTWLEGIWESFQDSEVMLVGGKNYPKWMEKPPFWIEEKWYQLCDYGHYLVDLSLIDLGNEVKEIPAWLVYGCNFSVRKSIIAETKGFHPDGMPFSMVEYRGDGETYVARYIMEHHYKVLYNPKASVYHLVTKDRLSIDYFKRREFRAGIERSYVEKRYGGKSCIANNRSIITKIMDRIFDRLVKGLYSKVMLTDIEKQLELSNRIGYLYHDALYKKSAKLREWVHKESYVD